MKKSKLINSIKQEFVNFINSFKKINTKYLYVILFDVLFYASAFLVLMLWNIFIMHVGQPIVDLQTKQMTIENVNSLSSSIQTFIIQLVISSILLVLLLILLFSIAQGLIWNKIYNKKTDLRFIKKFYFLNLFFLPLYVIFLFIIAVVCSFIFNGLITFSFLIAYKNNILAVVISSLALLLLITPIIMHAFAVLNIVYMKFVNKHKIFISIGDMLKLVFKKAQNFYLPYLFATLFIVASSLVLSPFKLFSNIYIGISLIFVLCFLAWFRFYLKDIVERIEHK